MLIGVIAEELLEPLAATSRAVWIDADRFWQARIFEIGFLAPGILDETADGGDEVYFQTFVTNGYQGIFPDLLSDPDETFYDFTQSLVPVLAPQLFTAADSFFTPNLLDYALHPVGRFVDTDIFYAPEFKGRILPDLIVDNDVIRAQVIRRDGDDIVLLLETFNDTDAVFAASASRAVLPGLVTVSDVIYVSAQGAFAAPDAFSSSDTFYIASIFNQLLPSQIPADDDFIGSTVFTPGRLGLFVDDDTFFVSSVQFVPLAPPLFVDADTFLPPVIGSNPALYPLFTDIDVEDTFYVPSVSLGLFLTPHLWPDIDNILSIPAVILGQALIPTAVFDDADVFYTPTLPPTLSPALFAPADSVFVPTLIFDQSLLPSWVTDTDTFFAPSMTALAAFDGTLALDGPIMPSTPQPTAIYIEG